MITQFPGVLLAIFLMLSETSRNGLLMAGVEACVIFVVQATVFAYFWFLFLMRPKRTIGRPTP
jgi:hypothetical protein